MSPGPRVRKNAGVQDDPAKHDESVKGILTANWSRVGKFSTKTTECTRTGVTPPTNEVQLLMIP